MTRLIPFALLLILPLASYGNRTAAIEVQDPSYALLPPCPATACNGGNLFCYGNFEAFLIGTDAYYCQVGPAACSSNTPGDENSVDIYDENGGEYLWVFCQLRNE